MEILEVEDSPVFMGDDEVEYATSGLGSLGRFLPVAPQAFRESPRPDWQRNGSVHAVSHIAEHPAYALFFSGLDVGEGTA
jgi:hypothetical protein